MAQAKTKTTDICGASVANAGELAKVNGNNEFGRQGFCCS